MKRIGMWVGILAGSMVILGACGGEETPKVSEPVSTIAATNTATAAPTSPPTATATATAEPEPELTAELVWFGVETGTLPVLRFVAAVKNPSATQSIEGMRLRWDALDASGARVGGVERVHGVIGPGETYYYVGGAGAANLSDVPVSVKLTITDPGKYSGAPSSSWVVEEVVLEGDSYSTDLFTAKGSFTAPKTLPRAQVYVNTILRDAAGEIIDAEFGGDVFSTLPETIEAGTKYRVSIAHYKVQGVPASVEVRVLEEPPR